MQCSCQALVTLGIVSSSILWSPRTSAEEPILKVGDMAPAFASMDADGRTWNSQELIGKQMLVVYFYPSDFSFSCTKQAVQYQQKLKELTNAGVTVVGVSGDQDRTHRLFKAAYGLDFTLLADEQGEVARTFGVPLRLGGKAVIKDAHNQTVRDTHGHMMHLYRKFTSARWTFIIDKEGRIANIDTSASPRHDSQAAFQAALQLASKK